MVFSTEFDYLKEEHIIRLHSIFKEKRLNPKFTPQLAKQLKLPEHVIVEFARWMAQREQRELDSYSTGNVCATHKFPQAQTN